MGVIPKYAPQGRGGRAGEGGRRAHRYVPFVYQFSRLWRSYSLVRSLSIPLLEESSGEPRRSRAADREGNRPRQWRRLGRLRRRQRRLYARAPRHCGSRGGNHRCRSGLGELAGIARNHGTAFSRHSASSSPGRFRRGSHDAAPRRHRGRQCHPLRLLAGPDGAAAAVASVREAGRASGRRRVRHGQRESLGAVSNVIRHLQGNGTSRGVYRSRTSWVETIALAGANLQRADAADPDYGCPITRTESVSVNERNELTAPSQRLRAFQTSSAGQRRAHSGATNG